MTMCMACGGRRHPVMPSCARQHPEATHCTCPSTPPPSDKLTLVLALSYPRAQLWAREQGLRRDRWHYVTNIQKLRGVDAHGVRLVLLYGWDGAVDRDTRHRVWELEARGAEVVRTWT